MGFGVLDVFIRMVGLLVNHAWIHLWRNSCIYSILWVVMSSPYRLDPSGVKGMMSQLQELLDQKFIWSSSLSLRSKFWIRKMIPWNVWGEHWSILLLFTVSVDVVSVEVTMESDWVCFPIYEECRCEFLGTWFGVSDGDCHHYLYNTRCQLYFDHKSLKLIQTRKNLIWYNVIGWVPS